MTSSASRFQRRTSNNLVAPGQCATCGSSTAKWFLDFGLDLLDYGAVYFCNYCLGDMATELDYSGPIETEVMMTTITNLHDVNNELVKRVEELEKLNALVLAASDYSSIVDWSDRPDIIAIQELVENAREADRDTRLDYSGLEETESGTSESDDEFGPTSFRDSDGYDSTAISNII